jgi:hypothetical protein
VESCSEERTVGSVFITQISDGQRKKNIFQASYPSPEMSLKIAVFITVPLNAWLYWITQRNCMLYSPIEEKVSLWILPVIPIIPELYPVYT